jgi:hypothetical protein
MRAFTLIIAAMALAALIMPAMAADVTIPINKDYKYGDMVVHITKAEITDRYKGNTYSADPENSIWPKVWFKYENKGTVAVNGNLYVAFMDDKGNVYWDSRNNKPIFDATMDTVAPGSTSEERFVEAAAPKGTKITKVILYNYEGKQDAVIDISTGSTSTAATAGPTTNGGSICGLSLLLPLIIIGTAAALKIKR